VLVKEVMTPKVVKVKPSDSILSVGNTLAERRISGAVVIENKKIVGVVSKESFVASVKYLGENPLESFKVRDFMTERYETAHVNEPLGDVVDRIVKSKQRVDRVLVLENGLLAGILTKTDISRLYSKHAKGFLEVKDLMNEKPPVVYDIMPVTSILKHITLAKEKRVVVMGGQKVLGIVTALDVSMALFEKLKVHKGKDPLDYLTLDEVITLNPITISKHADAAQAAKTMVEKKIGGLPVFNGKLSGLITKNDIIKGYKLFKDGK
jgi:CBS domain-containing protein